MERDYKYLYKKYKQKYLNFKNNMKGGLLVIDPPTPYRLILNRKEPQIIEGSSLIDRVNITGVLGCGGFACVYNSNDDVVLRLSSPDEEKYGYMEISGNYIQMKLKDCEFIILPIEFH